MVLNRLADRAEDHAGACASSSLKVVPTRDAVENRIDGDLAALRGGLAQRPRRPPGSSAPSGGCRAFHRCASSSRIDLIERFGLFQHALGPSVVVLVLVIDGRQIQEGPVRLLLLKPAIDRPQGASRAASSGSLFFSEISRTMSSVDAFGGKLGLDLGLEAIFVACSPTERTASTVSRSTPSRMSVSIAFIVLPLRPPWPSSVCGGGSKCRQMPSPPPLLLWARATPGSRSTPSGSRNPIARSTRLSRHLAARGTGRARADREPRQIHLHHLRLALPPRAPRSRRCSATEAPLCRK